MNMATTITVEVSYGQLAICASVLLQPFNDWTDKHVAQGFAWRPGSVSFRTMVEVGAHSVEIELAEHVGALHPDVVRAIEVPFEVPADGAIEIGSISHMVPLTMPVGTYLLRCEFLQRTSVLGERVRLVFATKDALHFAIARADDSLSSDGELLTTAQAAPG